MDEPALPEVARRLDEVFKRYEQIANDLPKTFVSKELFEASKELTKAQIDAAVAQHIVLQKQVESLEEDKTWLYRLIIGAIVLAVLGLLFTATHTYTAKPTKTTSGMVSTQ